MRQIRDRVAGLDVHRDTVVASIRIAMSDGSLEVSKERFSTTRKGLSELAAFLLDGDVTTVAMEATGVYWRPVYYVLEGLFPELWLCNAQHVKNVPGRKTDLSDAEWLSDVAAHGMVRPSLVPPPEIRELRELTRYRKTQIDTRAREIQRLEKVLQDAGVKLTSVASTVWSKSSRAMVEAMIAGERDPAALSKLAKGVLAKKSEQLAEALDASFTQAHAFLCRQIISLIDHLDESITEITQEITSRLLPFEQQITLLTSITGVSLLTAQVMIAETGGDMSKFPTSGHLCAWAGVAPASYESAGKKRPAGTRKGSPWLRRTLIEAARAAAHSKNSYYSAQYARIARRRGPNKAAVAVAHSILDTAWHLITTGAYYQDPGSDYFERTNDPLQQVKRLQQKIESLGYDVTLTEKAAV
jgi:transposase